MKIGDLEKSALMKKLIFALTSAGTNGVMIIEKNLVTNHMEANIKAKRCKHHTGSFFESIEAYHERQVIDGKLDPDSFNNEYGNGLHHTYECKLCGKHWKWKYKPRQKWLDELFTAAYSENID